MNKDQEKSTNPDDKTTTAAHDAAFDRGHEKELGFKRFAYIQSLYLFVPMITAAVGALIGYHTLGRPLTKILPKSTAFAGTAEKIAGNFKNLSLKDAAKAAQLHAEGKSGAEIMKKLGMKLDEVPKTAKVAGAWILGAPAFIAGNIAVGYDKWRKDESSRLSADEINHDIANLELFKPSNPELVEENKRLRSMLASAPTTVQTKGIERDGTIAPEAEKQLA